MNLYTDLDKIIDREHNIMKNVFSDRDRVKDADYRTIVQYVLMRLRCPTNYKGYLQLVLAIELVLEDEDYSIRIFKDAYPIIAKRYNQIRNEKATVDSVEHALRTVIGQIWKRRKNNFILELLFGYMDGDDKPINSEFICAVANYIKVVYTDLP